MFAYPKNLRQRAIAFSAMASLCLALVPPPAFAAGNARLLFRPHCNDAELENKFGGPLPDLEQLTKLTEGTCRSFAVRDPESVQTDILRENDILDIDVILENPDKEDIKRFRAWIAYDTSIFEGIDLAISQDFPIPTPGENEFVAADGYIKLSGTANNTVNDELILLARVRLRVKQPQHSGSPLIFYDANGTAQSKTGAFEEGSTEEVNVLASSIGYLFARFDVADAAQEASVSSPSTDTTAGQTSSPPAAQEESSTGADHTAASVGASTVFTMLQVQGLRVTTEGSSVFLAWDHLPSSELNGYYVYYGTTSGRYIQRRAVEKNANSITIRALPVGTTYYFAVRAVNAANQETEFSNEVGISVGNPRTSTAPLTGSVGPATTPGTNGSVAGETGVSSGLLFLLTGSAIAGTFVAFRRQWSVR